MNSILQPLEGVSIETMGGVKAQVVQNLIAPCAVGVIVELHPRGVITQKLNVDLVPGRAAVVGSGVGKEGRNDPRHRCWPHGDFVQAVTEERSEEHTSELQSRGHLVCRLLLEKKKLR